MEFLGMIAVGFLGLFACFRVFLLCFKGIGVGFDKISHAIFHDDDD